MLLISALTKRQPIVVSSTFAARENGSVAFAITNGARLMLSMPPAIKAASPARIARAALPTASSPEPHSRLIVGPGTSTGRPASSDAILATLRLSSPAWFVQPNHTSSTASQSTLALRAMSALIGTAPRSSARTDDNEPP